MDINVLYHAFGQCNGVTTDSRKCPAESMFFALKGDTFDGNAFAAKALDNGCAYAVVDNAAVIPEGDKRYILVDDCLCALQQLARMHRRRLGTPVIGITGTNGKTTTKELIAAVLSVRHSVLYTSGNFNNHIGVPLTLLRLRPEHTIAVVEMGASHPGDIRELVGIAEPDYGIITNVGKAHLEGFGSQEGVMRTKGELFDYLREKGGLAVFVNADYPYLIRMAHGLKQISYGSNEGLYVSGHALDESAYLTFTWQADDGKAPHKVRTRLIGDYNLPNALAAITIGRFFGVEADEADRAIEEYVPQNNRSQLKETGRNTLVIDAYNANPASMMASIDNFYRMQAVHKMLILGDMLELGKDSPEEHRKIVEHLQACGFSDVALVGAQFTALCPPYPVYPDVDSLISELQRKAFSGKTILIKGSNSIRLSAVADYL